jgi:hypothetical protein
MRLLDKLKSLFSSTPKPELWEADGEGDFDKTIFNLVNLQEPISCLQFKSCFEKFKDKDWFQIMKGNKFIACQLIEGSSQFFYVDYRLDVQDDVPMYRSKDPLSAADVADIYDSFYRETDTYLHKISWKISDWYREQYPDYIPKDS